VQSGILSGYGMFVTTFFFFVDSFFFLYVDDLPSELEASFGLFHDGRIYFIFLWIKFFTILSVHIFLTELDLWCLDLYCLSSSGLSLLSSSPEIHTSGFWEVCYCPVQVARERSFDGSYMEVATV
jgi:hypothetical protein